MAFSARESVYAPLYISCHVKWREMCWNQIRPWPDERQRLPLPRDNWNCTSRPLDSSVTPTRSACTSWNVYAKDSEKEREGVQTKKFIIHNSININWSLMWVKALKEKALIRRICTWKPTCKDCESVVTASEHMNIWIKWGVSSFVPRLCVCACVFLMFSSKVVTWPSFGIKPSLAWLTKSLPPCLLAYHALFSVNSHSPGFVRPRLS